MTRRWTSIGLLACLLAWVAPAAAAQLAGQRFDDVADVAGAELTLNGLGLRTVFIIKAFVAALYVPTRTSDPAELLAQSGPRRLSLRMLTDLTAARITKSFTDGMDRNLAESERAALRPQIEQLVNALKTIGLTRKGDTVALDLIDGATCVTLNGKPQGAPIAGGEELYRAILRAFIGPRPADADLKRGLLGHETPPGAAH